MRIAIIGGGISGLLAARLLDNGHDIHVFEADSYAGGHTNTVTFDAFGRRYAADIGFTVFNDRTYPNFATMLRLLGLAGRPCDMSFSVRRAGSGLEYQGSSLNGLFAQRRNLFSAAFHRMLLDLLRFNRRAREFLQDPDDDATLGEYLERGGYDRQFIEDYVIPMAGAIWSARPDRLLEFPARFIIASFNNHGLLQVSRHARWQTVRGGASRYVKALIQPFAHRIRLNCRATWVHRQDEGVTVASLRGAPERFDCVVLATHADQSLALIANPTDAEREILSSIPYERHDAVLHLDRSMLPRSRRAWASRNYQIPAEPGRPAVLTYNLSRLQGLWSRSPICVTLNDTPTLDETKTLGRIAYDHPTFSREGRAAQKRFHEINGKNRTYFCGAYWGHGLHEDGVNSALTVGQCFGRGLECLQPAPTRETSGTGA